MLPINKAWYKFLIDFDKKAGEYKNNNDGESKRRVLKVDSLIELLNKHINLNPLDPLSFNEEDKDEFYLSQKIEIIEYFFEQQNMKEMIQIIDNDTFGITNKGYKAINDYKHEIIKTIILPIISIIITVLGLIFTIIYNILKND